MRSIENELATLGFTIIRNLLKVYDPYEPKGFFSVRRSARPKNEKLLAAEVAFDLSQAFHNFPYAGQEEMYEQWFKDHLAKISEKVSVSRLLDSVIGHDLKHLISLYERTAKPEN